MKIVKFENGMYGIRSSWFLGWRFVDLRCPGCRWKSGDSDFKDCLGTIDQCLEIKATLETLGKTLKYEIVPED
jgi:hypothetical protein